MSEQLSFRDLRDKGERLKKKKDTFINFDRFCKIHGIFGHWRIDFYDYCEYHEWIGRTDQIMWQTRWYAYLSAVKSLEQIVSD